MFLITWSTQLGTGLVTRDNLAWLPTLPHLIYIVFVHLFYEIYYLVWDSNNFQFHPDVITFYRVKGVHIKYIKTKIIPTLYIIFCSIIIILLLLISSTARSVCSSEASLFFFIFYAHKVFDYIFRTILENILLGIVIRRCYISSSHDWWGLLS